MDVLFALGLLLSQSNCFWGTTKFPVFNQHQITSDAKRYTMFWPISKCEMMQNLNTTFMKLHPEMIQNKKCCGINNYLQVDRLLDLEKEMELDNGLRSSILSKLESGRFSTPLLQTFQDPVILRIVRTLSGPFQWINWCKMDVLGSSSHSTPKIIHGYYYSLKFTGNDFCYYHSSSFDYRKSYHQFNRSINLLILPRSRVF